MPLQNLDHKHIFVYATVRKPPVDPEKVKDWFVRLVAGVGMNVVIKPQVVNLQTPGNEGITGVVTIETSHSSIHVWESPEIAFLQFDLYSCKAFDPAIVLQFISEFEPYFYEYMLVDRNDAFKVVDRRIVQVLKVVDTLPEAIRDAYLESKRIKDRTKLTPTHRKAQSEYNKAARHYSARSSTYSKRRVESHASTLSCIKLRSKKMGVAFDLDATWYEAALQLAKQQWPRLVSHGAQSFWSADVDRVDPTAGYVKTNCRIIPHALNVAKWNWSPEELEELKELVKAL